MPAVRCNDDRLVILEGGFASEALFTSYNVYRIDNT